MSEKPNQSKPTHNNTLCKSKYKYQEFKKILEINLSSFAISTLTLRTQKNKSNIGLDRQSPKKSLCFRVNTFEIMQTKIKKNA